MSLHIEQLQTHNPQKFWNEINKLGPCKKKEIPMVVTLENGECCSDVGIVLQKWEKDFTDLFSGCNHALFDESFLKEVSGRKGIMESEMSSDTYNCNFYLNVNFTIEEVKRVVEKSKLRKATGIDEISYEVLKSPNLLPILFQLFQTCFDSGIVPSQWYKTIIKPIPKSSKSDPKLPLSYRGISLISNVYKLYSSLLNNRLTDHFERSGLLVDEQNGFRKARSCVDHIYSVTTIVRARLQENKSTYACFIDFQKAFDWVNRELLEYSLITSGVNGKFYAAIKALYRAPIACVQVNTFRTGWFPTHFGVKQGDVLSPTLFSMYVNDLALKIRNSKLGVTVADMTVGILLYADDIILLADCEKDLQNMLNIAADWCLKWRLVVNDDKTQIVHFRKPSVKRSLFSFMFGTTVLIYTKTYKYLGLTLDEHMNFKEGIQVLADSAGRALGSVLNKVKACKDLGYHTYTQLYQSCVCPVSDYASGVWGFHENVSCNTIQNRAIRSFLGVHKLTPILAISGDMGWTPVNIRHKGEMLRLWNRLVKMSDDRLTKKIFNWDISNGYPWATEVKYLFFMNNSSFIYLNRLSCNVKDIQNYMFLKYKDSWSIDLWGKPKLRTYRLIKKEYSPEPYVMQNVSKSQRSLCAQLHSGTLPLALETGRFIGTPEEDRICLLCDLEEIESEIHFLFYCPLYDAIRHQLFSKMTSICVNFFWVDDYEKLEMCFSKGIFSLAAFVSKAWEKRQSVLYV